MLAAARVVKFPFCRYELEPGWEELPDENIVAHMTFLRTQARLLVHEANITAGRQRAQTLDKLSVLLATHRIAAEVVVRPMLASMILGDWRQDRQDEDRIRDRLGRLCQLDPADPRWRADGDELGRLIRQFFQREKDQYVPLMLSCFDQQTRYLLRRKLYQYER